MLKNQKHCISYPENKDKLISKSLVLLLASSVSLYLAYDYYNNKMDITFFSLSLLGIGGLWVVTAILHRQFSYDEICINDEYFIVKKKGVILSKTNIDDVFMVSRTSPFDMFQIASRKIYSKDTMLFHYASDEIKKSDDEKLTSLIREASL